MKTDKKKDTTGPYSARGIRFGRDPNKFAANLAKAMNELKDKGNELQMLSIPLGIVLIARREEEQEEQPSHPLKRFIDLFAPQHRGDVLPGRVASFLRAVESKVPPNGDIEVEIPKVVPGLLQETPLPTILEVAKECEESAAAHENAHADDASHHTTCRLPLLLRTVAREMRGFAKLHVQ